MDGRIRLRVNGGDHDVQTAPGKHLLHVLREELGLTGAKPGCGEGECGACTVLLDGEPVRACQVAAGDAAGRSVTTIEGLSAPGRPHPVQRAFAEVSAMQCGYCTPGMTLAAAALLRRNPAPDEAEVRQALGGNLCRCGTYTRILAAVRRAADIARLGTDGGAGPDAAAPLLPAPVLAPFGDADPGTLAFPGRPGPWDMLPPERRDYFEALGDGLVAHAGAEPERTGGRHGGAWVHVGAAGRVRAFTGKADVGQETGAALGLLVAEELRVRPADVTVVMGDTDVCPFDFGTFGSRSMPDAAPRMRAAAAAAREALIEIAALRWGMAPGDLTAEAGRVLTAGAAQAARGIPYAELLRGQRRLVAAGPETAVTPPARWVTAGRALPGVTDAAAAAASGAKRYATDASMPGMRHGRVLRAPAIGARLLRVDTAAARAIPGVTVVEDGEFVGVVAPDRLTALRAIEAVRAEWEAGPGTDNAGLEAYLRGHPAAGRGQGAGFHHAEGDADAALAAAARRVAATYTAAYIAHAPLETRAALAWWPAGGRLTVWTGSQRPFGVRGEVAAALGIPEEQVRVVIPPTGSGFGGRHNGAAAVEAARLARSAGCPVKVAWTRQEEFTCGYFRPAAVIDVEAGLDGSGRLSAWTFKNFNSGAPGIQCPYDVPNQRIDHQPCDSPLPQGSYRALAATANTFARESHIDEMAREAGADPLEFRLRHLTDDRLGAVLRAAAARFGWGTPPPGRGRGAGIAAGAEKGGRIATCAEVSVDEEGRLRVLRIVAAFECGAIVHPDGLKNQVEGALVMGLGGALSEAIRFEGGRVLNASFSGYRVPRLGDVPPIDVILIDRPDVPSAGGGETPIIAIAPAIANAIRAATGVRPHALPLAPEGFVTVARRTEAASAGRA